MREGALVLQTFGSPFIEIWDGKRFFELKWFWDPEKRWLLPVRCPECSEIVSADILASTMAGRCTGQVIEGTALSVECPHCFGEFIHHPMYTHGDPKNIALIGHWDGWQPFSTSARHSCGKLPMILHYYIYSWLHTL